MPLAWTAARLTWRKSRGRPAAISGTTLPGASATPASSPKATSTPRGKPARAWPNPASSFGTDDTEGPYGVQMYLVQREAGRLEAVRPLITGEESPAQRWAPGLLALYTELGLEQPARRLLRWLLERYTDHDRDSGDWPIRLVFMAEAAIVARRPGRCPQAAAADGRVRGPQPGWRALRRGVRQR